MMQSIEILYTVVDTRLKQHNRPFCSRSALERAVKREFAKQGITAIRAQYDSYGDCMVCGECGRCPGYHTPDEVAQRQPDPTYAAGYAYACGYHD